MFKKDKYSLNKIYIFVKKVQWIFIWVSKIVIFNAKILSKNVIFGVEFLSKNVILIVYLANLRGILVNE